MDMEIDSQNIRFPKKPNMETEKGKPPKAKPTPIRDTVVPGSSKPLAKPTTSANTPALLNPPSSGKMENLNTQSINLIKKHNLPKGKDLLEKLSTEIKQLLNKYNEESVYNQEIKKFFDLLSKLYPFSLSILSNFVEAEEKLPLDFSNKSLQMLSDLGKLLSKQINGMKLPTELKHQLIQITTKLENLPQFAGNQELLVNEIETLLKTLETLTSTETQIKALPTEKTISFDTNPKLFEQLQKLGLLSKEMLANQKITPEEIKTLLVAVQNKNSPIKLIQPLLRDTTAILTTLGMLNEVPQKNLQLATTSLLASQHIQAPPSEIGLIGPSVNTLSDNIGQFILKIQQDSKLFGQEVFQGKAAERLYSNAFKQVILSGAILGHLLAGKGKEAADDMTGLSVVKFHSAKELGIIDQIPFSFMAFFADLSSKGDDASDAIKEAKNSLIRLIRLLLKLVFILAALTTAGNNLGEKGMKTLIEENIEFLSNLLDDLTFALKKVDECYGVSVNFQLALIRQAKEGLMLKDSNRFLTNAIHLFSPKTELGSFLQDIKEADPLFQTIESLLTDSDDNLSVNIRMSQ